MKRRPVSAEQIEACKRRFWEESAMFVLYRSRDRVRKGLSIERADAPYIDLRLDELADREYERIKAMVPSRVRAQLADYLTEKLRIPRREAIAAVAGEYSASAIDKAITRLRKARALRGRRRRK